MARLIQIKGIRRFVSEAGALNWFGEAAVILLAIGHYARGEIDMKSHFIRSAAALIALILLPASGAAPADQKMTVLSPMGKPPSIQMLAMAPRLDTLKGKTIYVVDDGYVGGDVLLNEVVAGFERNMPEVKAVYRRKAGGFTDEDPKLWDEIKAEGDAMIVGVGH